MFKSRFLVERGTETMNNKYQECLNFLCRHAMEYIPEFKDHGFILGDELDEYRKPLQELIDNATQWDEEYVYKLEKALDEACEELASMEYKLNMSKDPLAYDCDYKDSDEWKELLWNNVERF